MLSPEYAPFTPADLDLLTPAAQAEFYAGRIRIGDDDKNYYLSGRIPAETPAPNLSARQVTAETIAQSLSAVKHRSSSLQERPFVSLSVNSMDPTNVGIAIRVELDKFGRLSPPDKQFLRDSLQETIKLANEGRGRAEMINEGVELIEKATERGSNLLCLFTLGGFFACRVNRMEERGISSRGGLLVPMPNEKIVQALHRPTEPESLYFLLRVKQLGEERIRAITPLVWTAIINCQSLLPLREVKLTHPFSPASHARPIDEVYRTGVRSGETPLVIDIRVPTYQKPSAFREKPHPRKPQRRF